VTASDNAYTYSEEGKGEQSQDGMCHGATLREDGDVKNKLGGAVLSG
jgi:hypothetical protein